MGPSGALPRLAFDLWLQLEHQAMDTLPWLGGGVLATLLQDLFAPCALLHSHRDCPWGSSCGKPGGD